MDGYESYFNNKHSAAGGLAIYVYSSFESNTPTNLSLLNVYFLEVTKPEPFLVGMIHRPLNLDFESFIYILDNIINIVYIMGDFNVNILKYSDINTQFLVNISHSNGSFSTVNKLTQVTNHSATLIDIWTNNFDNYVCSGIIFNSISDQFPIISSFSSSKSVSAPKPITFATRKLKN